MTENGIILWLTLYFNYLEEINNNPIDIIGLLIDNTEDKIIEEKEKLSEDNKQDKF